MKKDMEKKMNIRLGFGCAAALLIAMMFASCTKVEMEAPSAKFGGEIRFGITKNDFSKPATKSASESESKVLVAHDPNDPESFGLSMTVVDGIQTPKSNLPATKGTQITDVNAFDVAAYYFEDASADGLLYFADQVSDGVNTTGEQYYWPMMGTMNFVATYPAGLIANGIQTIADDNGNLRPFSYTIPEDVTAQQDIMVAVTNGIENAPRSQSGAAVGLNFQHLLAAVQFKVGEMQFIHLNSITLSGLNGGQISFRYNPENESDEHPWKPLVETPVDQTYTFTNSEDSNSTLIDTDGLPTGSEITGNDNGTMLFVLPQTIGTDNVVSLTVNYSALLTGATEEKTITLPAHELVAGKTTVYSLNVGTTFNVTIPTPPDQDAHYIMLHMDYDLGAISDKIGTVTATAQFDSATNTSSKSGISLKMIGDLTTTQQNGYWTDEKWELVYSVDSDGNITDRDGNESVDASGNPVVPEPIQTIANIRGSESIQLTSMSGTIVLFIEENNGTTNRDGKLILTATLSDGTTSVTLGEGSFTQYCPSWNGSTSTSIGVERIEEGNAHPYGFQYDRTVTYDNTYKDIPLLRALTGWVATWYVEESDFIKLNWESGWFGVTYLKSIEIDYSSLNAVNSIANSADGINNTKNLYEFTGSGSFADTEASLNDLWGFENGVANETEIPDDYAAFIALSCNRMRELYTEIKTTNGNTKNTRPVLHEDSNGNNIIEWYLPSSAEAVRLKETGGLSENDPISPLNGEYWSSTAGSDTDAQAHSYIYENNTYKSVNTTKGRMENLKVRAVRKKPTAN